MPLPSIGEWIARDRAGSRKHLVESTVAGRALTRCGRYFLLRDARGRELIMARGHADGDVHAVILLGRAKCETCATNAAG